MGDRKALIFYVMGPSGAGKDSLLDALRPQLQGTSVVCIHRYVTRPSQDGEQHVPLTADEFEFRKHVGLFAMDWQANGYRYALGMELRNMLERGISVIMNGSREFYQEACQLFPGQLVPVVVSVPEEILEQRLLARNRETKEEIDARLARNRAWVQQCDTGKELSGIRIDNSGSIHQATDSLLKMIISRLVSLAPQQGALTQRAVTRDVHMNKQPLETLRRLYETWGHKNYGEKISQYSHALQAAELARDTDQTEEMILAAFLHDVGHLLVLDKNPEYAEEGRLKHEDAGAAFLQTLGFNRAVTEPIAAHVAAKRYLCCIDQNYYEGLSDASRHSLEFQGGPMKPEEAEQFAGRDDIKDILQLRQFDEQAKDTSFEIKDTGWIYSLIESHLTNTPIEEVAG